VNVPIFPDCNANADATSSLKREKYTTKDVKKQKNGYFQKKSMRGYTNDYTWSDTADICAEWGNDRPTAKAVAEFELVRDIRPSSRFEFSAFNPTSVISRPFA